jgi:hypothetical protein
MHYSTYFKLAEMHALFKYSRAAAEKVGTVQDIQEQQIMQCLKYS